MRMVKVVVLLGALGWLGFAAPKAAVSQGPAAPVVWVAYAIAFSALWFFHRRQAAPVSPE